MSLSPDCPYNIYKLLAVNISDASKELRSFFRFLFAQFNVDFTLVLAVERKLAARKCILV